ncbi:MAG TPA: SDR family oxidoreductase [Gemmataceae bacterium]|jgi:UDP-glucose 4-epimerase|nr:SDR family oxidoreductase [Gemmataceae bacterium]
MALCLVTGGAGFIGSHLVDSLVAYGHEIRVLDNLSTGDASNLAQVRSTIEFIRGDVTDLAAVRAACRGVEFVFHQAALASVPRSIADPLATHQACTTGTLHVLMAAREAQVRRVIYAGSSSAYGAALQLPKRESDATLPLSPYAVAKLCGEEYCSAFTTVYGLETVRLRYFNVFGPRQPPGSPYSAVIPLFIEAMLAGRSPTIYGDGLQSRDFTYVRDVVQANLLAAEAPRVAGKVFNIACGRRTTLLDLIGRINDVLGTRIRPVHADPRPGDVQHSQADISRAQVELGFCPCTDIKQDLRHCIDYYRGSLDQGLAPADRHESPQGPRVAGAASR